MLGCRFSFEAYAKKVREKSLFKCSTKCSLKTDEVLLDADRLAITKCLLSLIFITVE